MPPSPCGARLPQWVIFDEGSELCGPAHFRFAPKADVGSKMRNWSRCTNKQRWAGLLPHPKIPDERLCDSFVSQVDLITQRAKSLGSRPSSSTEVRLAPF